MIYEYRVYEAVPGKLPMLHARFRDHVLKMFERHRIKSIGYWTNYAGDDSNRLIYVLSFENAQQRQEAWASFRSDPQLERFADESERDGHPTARVMNTLLTPTDYSPLR